MTLQPSRHLTRTDAEILARIEAVKKFDWLGTQRDDLMRRLPFEAVSDVGTAEQWEAERLNRDAERVTAEMHDYMPFAWGKANNRRGLSAGRNLDHMSAWLFLLGEDAAADAILKHDHYGKPQLRAICEGFDWDWRQWDDGLWTNDELEDGSAPPETVPVLPWAENGPRWLRTVVGA